MRLIVGVAGALLCTVKVEGEAPGAARKIIRTETLTIANRDFTVFVDYQRPNAVVQIATTVVAEDEKFKFSNVAVSAFGKDGKEIAIRQTPAQAVVFSRFGSTASGAFVTRVNDDQQIVKVEITYRNEMRSFPVEADVAK